METNQVGPVITVLALQGTIDATHGTQRKAIERRLNAHYFAHDTGFTTLYERKAERITAQTDAANSLTDRFVKQPAIWQGTPPVTPFQQPVTGVVAQDGMSAPDALIAEARAILDQDMKRIDVLRGIAASLSQYTTLLNEAGETGEPERFIEEAKRVAQMFAVAAIEAANGAGLDLTIERRPAYPLAMGNFMLAIEIGECNKSYRARFAREAAEKEAAAADVERDYFNVWKADDPSVIMGIDFAAGESVSHVPEGFTAATARIVKPVQEVTLDESPVAMGHPYLPYPTSPGVPYHPV